MAAAKLGAILKTLRRQKGWKLSDVAAKTGYPVSTLSKLENNKVSFTYDKMARLSKALEVDIGLLLAKEEPAEPATPPSTGRRSIIRKDEGRVIETDTYRYRFVATDLLNKRFIPIFGESYIRSIDEFGEMFRHAGEEFTYVIEGALELHTELYAPVKLEAGEAIYFDSGLAHAYIDVGSTPCRTLTICSGDESRLMYIHQRELNAPDQKAEKPVAAKRKR